MSFKILGIGEVLWDLLPSGPQLGGAPANFACHSQALGAQAGLISRVGSDSFGRAIFQRFQELGVAVNNLQVDDKAPTGAVAVTLSGEGVPHFTIHENVAWDGLEPTPAALEAVRDADAICFGSLAQRSETARASIQKLITSAPVDAWRIFDVNLREPYFSREVIEQSLGLANVLKLNDSELEVLGKMFGLAGPVRQQIESLARQFNLRLVALTRGSAGSLLFQEGRWSDCPSVPIKIVDTVGAGDAFAATLAMGLLQKMELDQINALANEVARYVCSCPGATPLLPKKFSDIFAAHDVA